MVSAKFGGGDGGDGGDGKSRSSLFAVTCARCDLPAAMPQPRPGRSRMPALASDGSTTLDADTACSGCGSMRVRVTLTI